jgi:hypothetical protein
MTMPEKMLSNELGPFQYNLVADWIQKNPEYEVVLSGDKACDDFMQSAEVKPEWQEAYKKARNGAEKADIWRYAVVYKYGGVYMDFDMTAFKPLRDIIDPEASVVQELLQKTVNSAKGGFEASQFALMFAPGHKLLEDTLDEIGRTFQQRPDDITLQVTGPAALARAYIRSGTCGSEICSDDNKKFHGRIDGPGVKRVCGKSFQGPEAKAESSCTEEKMGKVVLLHGQRDLNTGFVWHKADVCAVSETRAKMGHWGQAGKANGGHHFTKEVEVESDF